MFGGLCRYMLACCAVDVDACGLNCSKYLDHVGGDHRWRLVLTGILGEKIKLWLAVPRCGLVWIAVGSSLLLSGSSLTF